ncbi:MAG: hypothetical protein P9M07_03785 [Candidatus Aceula meridiana]|nr:hypothetical protein [Candidatus Aceula meridiana]
MLPKFLERMLRAAKFDKTLYEEVEADKSLLQESMLVVLLASLAAGIGNIAIAGIGGVIIGLVAALVGWFVWAYLVFFIGTKILPEPETKADVGQLLRTLGFASAPGVLRIFGIIPGFAPIIFTIAGLWMLGAMVIAVRQALDYTSTIRAVGVCLIGWVIQAVVITIISMLVIAPAASMGVVG